MVLSFPLPPQSEDLTDGDPLAFFTLAQAVHASARFPYISPALSVVRGGVTWGHLVDGGYFENSGAVTAKEILDEVATGKLQPEASTTEASIQNGVPCTPPRASTARVIIIRYCEPRQPVARWATELTAPPTAFFAARDARGRLAVNSLKRSFNDQAEQVAEFCLKPGNPPLPLGWMLSDSAQAQIDEQARSAIVRLGPQVARWLEPNRR